MNSGEFPENPTIFPKNYHKMAIFRQTELLLGGCGTCLLTCIGELLYWSHPDWVEAVFGAGLTPVLEHGYTCTVQHKFIIALP